MRSASDSELRGFEERLGYEFRDRTLLEAALTHTSALARGSVRAGEQLEFLGDAVIDLAVADLLLGVYPEADEGQLSKLRALLVQTSSLAIKGSAVGVAEMLRLGRGEEKTGGRSKISILAAAYESVIGAIYRDGGFERARAAVARHFSHELAQGCQLLTQDWKTTLQERTQARARVVPEYRVLEERGPAHARQFLVEVSVDGERLTRGEGASKREAEQEAARRALSQMLEREIEEPSTETEK